mgnify:CR=1 FL=1
MRRTGCLAAAALALVCGPNEYLREAETPEASAIHGTPVRYLEGGVPDQTLTVVPPLRVLVMVASPRTGPYPPLDVDKELTTLRVLTSSGVIQPYPPHVLVGIVRALKQWGRGPASGSGRPSTWRRTR